MTDHVRIIALKLKINKLQADFEEAEVMERYWRRWRDRRDRLAHEIEGLEGVLENLEFVEGDDAPSHDKTAFLEAYTPPVWPQKRK